MICEARRRSLIDRIESLVVADTRPLNGPMARAATESSA